MNAMHRFLAAAHVAAALALSPVALADTVSQERAVQGFNGLGLAIPAKVEVVQGDREGLTLTGDAAALAHVETVVDDGALKIRWKRDGERRRGPGRIHATLRVRNLESISIAGSGDVIAESLRAPRLAVRISGSGDVRLGGGGTDALEVRISGSGDVDARKFEARRATVRIAGSGDARLWVRDTLDVNVAGSGDVRYYGDPSVSQRIAGSGSVRRAGASPG